MSDIVQELIIEATPENVFDALTLPDGIAEWWSNHVTAEPKVGSLNEIRFENGGIFKMEITDLEAGKKVYWRCRLSPHDWEGSTITWDITPISKGVRLLFGQHNLTVGDTGYSIEETCAGWEYFLESLKSYLETGKGTPYVYERSGDVPVMNHLPITPEERFATLIEALHSNPDVTPPSDGKAFGSSGLKIHNKIFSMLAGGRLVVKLPKSRVDVLVASGDGERFDPRKNGQVMKEWLTVEPASELEWLSLAKEAMEFAASQR